MEFILKFEVILAQCQSGDKQSVKQSRGDRLACEEAAML